MTELELLQNKHRAIAYFGLERYTRLLYIAEQYCATKAIQPPSGGVEYLPAFWTTINQLIADLKS